MELILTWVIKAEHTGALPGNPSFAWIKKGVLIGFYIFVHRHPVRQKYNFIPTVGPV